MIGVVRPPKKLRDRCEQLLWGFDPTWLPSPEEFPKHVAQVDAVLAQAAVFTLDWDGASGLCRESVLAADQWYSGNFLEVKLAALTFVAVRTDTRSEALAWLSQWLETRSAVPDTPAHVLRLLRRQREIQELAMAGRPTGLKVWQEAEDPEPLSVFIAQLAEYRKGVSPGSVAGIDYMLHFIADKGAASDFLEQYEKVKSEMNLDAGHHVTAARIFAARGDTRAAQDSLLRWSMLAAWAIEATDILPMAMFTFYDLYPVYTDEFLAEVREQRRVSR